MIHSTSKKTIMSAGNCCGIKTTKHLRKFPPVINYFPIKMLFHICLPKETFYMCISTWKYPGSKIRVRWFYWEDLNKISVSLALVGRVKHLEYVWTRTLIKIKCIVKTEGCRFTRFLKVTLCLVCNRGRASEVIVLWAGVLRPVMLETREKKGITCGPICSFSEIY